MKKKMAVVLGRFQNHRIHEGYKALFKEALANYDYVLVVIGEAIRKANPVAPLPPAVVKQLIKDYFSKVVVNPEFSIVSTKDNRSNEVWSKNLDIIVESNMAANGIEDFDFIVGRDSFRPFYSGKYDENFKQVEDIKFNLSSVNSTADRESLKHLPKIANPVAFAQGIIWTTQNQYPRIDPTVDVAIIRSDTDVTSPLLLLGKKYNEDKWRLPGGFVDVTDESFFAAAVREVREETNVILNETDLQYKGTLPVNDWRYRKGVDKVFTTVFIANLNDSSTPFKIANCMAGDDLEEVKWFLISEVRTDIIVEEHVHLIWDIVDIESYKK